MQTLTCQRYLLKMSTHWTIVVFVMKLYTVETSMNIMFKQDFAFHN